MKKIFILIIVDNRYFNYFCSGSALCNRLKGANCSCENGYMKGFGVFGAVADPFFEG